MYQLKNLSRDELDDQWHGLLLKTFLKLRGVIEAAKARGVDQKALAKRIDMNEAQLSRLLRGESNVTLKTMHKLARAADCRLEIELKELAALSKPNMPSFVQTPVISNSKSSIQSSHIWGASPVSSADELLPC